MQTVTISSESQVVIPREIIAKLEWKPGKKLQIEPIKKSNRTISS
ncbi:hypothetical protein BGP_0599 [Beggiatoa sp. PS]|nr:hypothetical protein BGP_0599 [Beggiatoa sp. PS]